MRYVDTSVLVAYYTPEDRSAQATEIVQQDGLLLGDVGIAEFYVAIARKARDGLLPQEAAASVKGLFEKHLGDGHFRRVPFHYGQVVAIRDFAPTTPVLMRTLDALHCAAALEVGAEMATFDKRLAEAARALGIRVI
jgi:predicted nucleic acid-binding protein